MSPKVLITGASGFIGRTVVADFQRRGWTVRGTANSNAGPGDFRMELSQTTDWSKALCSCDTVVHLAARAHVLDETATNPLTQYMAINAEATRILALAARSVGVERFIFISSIAVNGPMRNGGLRETDTPRPETDYGRSKLAAEQYLLDIAANSAMSLTILRPPLVFGPGVGARFLQLIKWADRGLPLPFGGIHNARSLVSVHNMTDAIAQCIINPAAAGETFLVADQSPISTSALITAIAHRLGKPNRLIAVPEALLRFGASLIGRGDDFEKLASSLVLDTSRITGRLNWTPPVSFDAALDQTIAWYRQRTTR